jgi:exodeoxyribonuclease V alpha subunit
MKLQEIVRGTIQRIVYSNAETGYTVLALQLEGERDPITAVGRFLAPKLGEGLVLHGQWNAHPRFGRQFQVEHYERNQPETIKGIKGYLSSMVKGIGPKKAKQIVDYFGIDTLRIIEHESERLTEVSGIGASTAERIREGWEQHKVLQEVMVFLQGYGVSQHHAQMIFRTYGVNSIRDVRENPYRLATEIRGIGFLTADQIAQSLGIPADSPYRARAAILFHLQSASEQGHMYLPYRELLGALEKEYSIPRGALEEGLTHLDQHEEVLLEALEEDTAVYLRVLAACERGSVRRLRDIMAHHAEASDRFVERGLARFEQESGIVLAAAQRRAVQMALQNSISIITGGPGTGKTTIIRAICDLVERQGHQILLAAPTGRAAKRLSEATGLEACTLHRTLEFAPHSAAFQRNQDNPLEGDIVIVDEVSMLDIYLFYALVRAIRPGAQLVLVGDVDQLPSVGPGNVLRDLLQSQVIPVTKLDQIFRQKEDGLIVENAHRINRGEMPILPEPAPEGLLDFYFIPREDPMKAVQTIREMVTQRIPQRFGLDPLQDIQVIAPMYKGEIGVKNLNTVLQEHFRKGEKRYIDFSGQRFCVGDRVLQTKNDYDKEVFNGDTGFITDLDPESYQMTVSFDDREVMYERVDLDTLTLAYAVSVHKSQGSEYPAIVIPIFPQHYMMLQRNLLYTALTRGKRLVVIVGTQRALRMAVQNDQIRKRYSRLCWRLQDASSLM